MSVLRISDRAKAFARADRAERRVIDLRAVIAETRDVIRIPAIEMEAARCFATDPTRNSCGLIKAGRDYVRIIVADDGLGVEFKTLKRIMEPVFTTKGRSEGTALDLPLAHAIVISYGGAYVIESAPGDGVSFDVFLPYDPPVGGVDGPTEIGAAPAARGKERVLIVDDEDDIRDVREGRRKRVADRSVHRRDEHLRRHGAAQAIGIAHREAQMLL